jgi:hypothetical protein
MKIYRYRSWPSMDTYELANSYQSVTHKYATWRMISAGPRRDRPEIPWCRPQVGLPPAPLRLDAGDPRRAGHEPTGSRRSSPMNWRDSV